MQQPAENNEIADAKRGGGGFLKLAAGVTAGGARNSQPGGALCALYKDASDIFDCASRCPRSEPCPAVRRAMDVSSAISAAHWIGQIRSKR